MTGSGGGDTGLYHGTSMYRVFVPGERLIVREIAPDELVCGDVVVVTYPDREPVVHRVIRKDKVELQTMGDNNSHADEPVRFDDGHTFQLVVEAESLSGERRRVINGAKGLRLFYRNQRRMKIRRMFSRILWSFESCFFWRLRADHICRFGDDEVYYYRSTPLARRYGNGRTVYLKWYLRLLYKVSAGK